MSVQVLCTYFRLCQLQINPSTAELIEKVRVSTPADVESAIAAARGAQTAWQDLGLAKRHELLSSALLKFHELPGGLEGLALLVTREMGKVISEARAEIDGAVNKEIFLRLVRAANEVEIIDKENGGSMIVRDPHGVVAVLAPWNFPADEILLLSLPALMAGNTVVVKPSEVTPLVGKAIVECLQQHLPTGVLNLLQGNGEVGRLLVTNKDIDMIGFTGSCPTGRSIIAAAGPQLKRIILELGGKDPMVVFGDADLDAAAEQAVRFSLVNCGQVCCAVERVYVDSSIKQAFEEKCVEQIKKWKAGDGMDPLSHLGPMVSRTQKELVLKHVRDAIACGAKCLYGQVQDSEGNLLQPILLTDVPQSAIITRQETFGPVVALTNFDGSEEKAVELSNDTEFGLTAAVFTQDLDRARRVASKIRAGQVYSINDTTQRCSTMHLNCKGNILWNLI